jgi:type IV pilus assembly protein PilY1
MKKFAPKKLSILSAVAASCLLQTHTHAAPGVLTDIPLNVGSRVQPNILFLVDDSGSMTWEQLISNEGQDAYGVGSNGLEDRLDFSPNDDEEVRELCNAYNVMAYDPTIVYEPWSGVDENGDAFDNKTLTTALNYAYDVDNTDSLTSHYYLSWNDSNTNNTFDVGECGDFDSLDAGYNPGSFPSYRMGDTTSSTDAAGYITDSGGASNNYTFNENLTFQISPVGASQITIDFSFFEVETGFDYLRVYANSIDPGNLVAELDGFSPPAPVTVNAGTVFLEFDSDHLVNHRGFIAFWNHSSSGIATPSFSNQNGIRLDDCREYSNCHVVSDLPATSTTEINTQQNYANWYTYYRKREYVAKKALSDIITEGSVRMGLATLHNNRRDTNLPVGTLIEDIDDISPFDSSDPVAVAKHNSAAANKAQLLRNLYNIRSNSGTPLRSTLNQAGQYFEVGSSPGSGLFGFTPNHSGTVSSNSPILSAADGGTCQQNFSVLFSDGFWNSDSGFSIGNWDGGTNTGEIPGLDGSSFADTYSNYLADVAMRYYERDIAGGLVDEVNVQDPHQSGVNINHQHMVTYTVAFGVNGTLDVNPDESGFTAWPSVSQNTNTTIDDMRHAAWNGRGEFLNANDPQELIDSLGAAIQDIQERTGSSSAASFSSGSVSNQTLVFQAEYNTTGWWGDLLAYQFVDGIIDADNPVWSASERMNSFLNSSGANARNIITYNGSQGIPFEFPASYETLLADGLDTAATSLSDARINDLLTNAPYPSPSDAAEVAANQAFGERVVSFLKGDNTSDDLRDRGDYSSGNFLGAFIHSSPIFVGEPSERYPDLIEGAGNRYSVFANANTDRTPLVFVGGNDGILHAFNATNEANGGREVFAYIPSANLLENDLHLLSESDYSHHAYVDGTPTVRDVFVNGSWRSYLVGSLRSGGKGVFVLDVTNPSALASASDSASNADSIVVGEFTHPDLGFTYSRPQITKMNDGSWVAIFGNGYNNSGDGTAKLFILFLDNLDDVDTSNDYMVIETKTGSIVNSDCLDLGSDCNGLSAPTLIDLNSDARVDRIYAGDVHGNLWAFDVSGTSQSSWGVVHGNSTTPLPLFRACRTAGSTCAAADRQPITARPIVSINPLARDESTEPNLLVYFGTGQFVAEGDNATTDFQNFYGVWDAGPNYGNLNFSDLTEQTFTSSLQTFTNVNTNETVTRTVRTLSNNSVSYNVSSNYGWRINLHEGVETGERVISSALLIGDIIFFLTVLPTTNICDGGGTSFLMAANAVDGSHPNISVFDLDGDGNPENAAGFSSSDFANNIKSIIGDKRELVVSGDELDQQDINTKKARSAGRKAWSILR